MELQEGEERSCSLLAEETLLFVFFFVCLFAIRLLWHKTACGRRCCITFGWLGWFVPWFHCHPWLHFVCREATVLWLGGLKKKASGEVRLKEAQTAFTAGRLWWIITSFLCSWKIIQLECPIVINSVFINQRPTQWRPQFLPWLPAGFRPIEMVWSLSAAAGLS